MRGFIGQLDDTTQIDWSRFKIAVTAEDLQTLFMPIGARGKARWSFAIAGSAPEGATPTSPEYIFSSMTQRISPSFGALRLKVSAQSASPGVYSCGWSWLVPQSWRS
jgi:hypothetical protein